MAMPTNAAEWLDRACDYENRGNLKSVEMSLNRAIKLDEEENAAGTNTLPRK